MAERDPRKVFGAALTAVAERNPDIVALSVDSGLSSGLGAFRDRFSDRYIELGIMEQAATGVAAGLATSGKIPVLCAIAPFVTVRNYEMFRNDVGYMKQNVKIVGRNGGMSYSQLGPTHHSLEDFAITRMIPGVTVLAPQDCHEIEAAVEEMVAIEGPVYMRIGAGSIPDLFADPPLKIGEARALRTGDDVTVISTGQLTAAAIEAADALADKGISVDHLGMATIQPLDADAILESISRTGRVVTIEEHYERGGLGGAVAELIARHRPVPHELIGVPHRYISSGPYEMLLSDCGLDAESLADRIGAFVTAS
ncbi:transketolase family protein [Microbacterium aureliae]